MLVTETPAILTGKTPPSSVMPPRRAVLNSHDMELIRSFSDMPEFRERLHQEAFEGTYERLYEFCVRFLRTI